MAKTPLYEVRIALAEAFLNACSQSLVNTIFLILCLAPTPNKRCNKAEL